MEKSDRAGDGEFTFEGRLLDQKRSDDALDDVQYLRQPFGIHGEQAAYRRRTVIGNDNTRWRTVTRGVMLSTRYAAGAMRRVPHEGVGW